MNNDPLIEKLTDFTLTLPTELKEKLDNHLQKLKCLHHPLSVRQYWLLNAIKEKLNRKKTDLSDSQYKNLNLKLPQDLVEELNALLKLSQNSYTKKKWLLEAIEEKIDAEKKMIQEEQQKPNKSMAKTTSISA